MRLIDYLGGVDRLTEQIASGMVVERRHSSFPLAILNYTQKAQFTSELWNDVTDKCRGLIYNLETGEIVSRPFVKFWNYADPRHPETMPDNLPFGGQITSHRSSRITRKMDGSLGILYRWEGQCYIATRGSFESEQAVWASKWLAKNTAGLWPEGWTPLFEIVYPENRIVVDYDFEGLVLLALVSNDTGEEADWEQTEKWAELNGLKVVDTFFYSNLSDCAAEDAENEEGYVVSWERPGTWPLRVKIKFQTYCRLHKLLTQMNAVTVWEMLRNGESTAEKVKDTPAEFQQWVVGVEARLLADFRNVEQQAWGKMDEWRQRSGGSDNRKEFALWATQHQPLTPILFSMLDRKEFSGIIWKMVRPRGDQRVFKVDADQ